MACVTIALWVSPALILCGCRHDSAAEERSVRERNPGLTPLLIATSSTEKTAGGGVATVDSVELRQLNLLGMLATPECWMLMVAASVLVGGGCCLTVNMCPVPPCAPLPAVPAC